MSNDEESFDEVVRFFKDHSSEGEWNSELEDRFILLLHRFREPLLNLAIRIVQKDEFDNPMISRLPNYLSRELLDLGWVRAYYKAAIDSLVPDNWTDFLAAAGTTYNENDLHQMAFYAFFYNMKISKENLKNNSKVIDYLTKNLKPARDAFAEWVSAPNRDMVPEETFGLYKTDMPELALESAEMAEELERFEGETEFERPVESSGFEVTEEQKEVSQNFPSGTQEEVKSWNKFETVCPEVAKQLQQAIQSTFQQNLIPAETPATCSFLLPLDPDRIRVLEMGLMLIHKFVQSESQSKESVTEESKELEEKISSIASDLGSLAPPSMIQNLFTYRTGYYLDRLNESYVFEKS